MLQFDAYIATILMVITGLACMFGPVIIDAHHWWPPKPLSALISANLRRKGFAGAEKRDLNLT